jgi:two-component system nitrate/nitrite response regulator NarL
MAFNPQLGSPERAGPVRVYIWTEDALAGDGLRTALRDQAQLECVAQPEGAQVLVWDMGSSKPELATVLGRLATARARAQAVVALAPDAAAGALALQQGVRGVVARRIHAPSLTAAIVAVQLGLSVLDSELADQYLSLPQALPEDGSSALTARERDVLQELTLGLSNKAIAERLEVSVHTVKFHVNSILAKLGADSRTAAVASALRRGLVTL